MYQNTAKGLAALGRKGDTMLMHVNPNEVEALSKILGPTTTNPQTGLPEASNWGMALNMLGGLATGVGGLGVHALLHVGIDGRHARQAVTPEKQCAASLGRRCG